MRDVESALAVLRLAIRNEITGQRFYNDAAFYCVDPWAKDVFANLASEEEKHTQLLLVEHKALETKGQWVDPEQALQGEAGADITRLTFADDEPVEELFPSPWSMGDAVDRRADDLAALALGVRMEQEAIDLYGEQRTSNPDLAAKRAYSFLVEEESRHYHQLKEQWERLAGRPFPET
jgi:rubrerythrin